MTDLNDGDGPDPAFRASLQQKILLAHRAGTGFAGRKDGRRVARMAGVAAAVVASLTLGLVLGASASYASAESLNERQRAATVNAVEAGQRFAQLRMQLARTNYDRAKRDYDRGQATKSALDTAHSLLDSARVGVSRVGVRDPRDTMPLPRPSFALLRLPLARSPDATCLPTGTRTGLAELPHNPTIPTVELPSADAKSGETFGMVMNVRELAGGKVLVNDGANRQVKVLESNLGVGRVIIDSVRGSTATNYGGRATSLSPFVGDSSLFANQANIISIIDPNGALTHSVTMPNAHDSQAIWQWRAGVDSASRILFMAEAAIIRPSADDQPVVLADSSAIVRADLATRRTDTLAYVARPLWRVDALGANGAQRKLMSSYWQTDPLRPIDEWAVLSSGALAIVRGHDYHVDIIRADGTKLVGPELPFDWRRVPPPEKEKLIDLAMAQRVAAAHGNMLVTGVERAAPAWHFTTPTPDTSAAIPSNNIGRMRMLVLPTPRPTRDHVFDYYPPVQSGSVIADLDDHLWILTNSPAPRVGELRYDVVANNGELIRRVGMSAGRRVVGFGHGGVVYTTRANGMNGFVVERSKLPLTR